MDATAIAVIIGAIAGLIAAATPLGVLLADAQRRADRRYAALDRRVDALERLAGFRAQPGNLLIDRSVPLEMRNER